jgi:sulfur carrier protein
MAQMASIFVNERPHPLREGSTLLAVLTELGLESRKGVAAAVDGAVVPRALWPERALSDGNRVLVIRATQGG